MYRSMPILLALLLLGPGTFACQTAETPQERPESRPDATPGPDQRAGEGAADDPGKAPEKESGKAADGDEDDDGIALAYPPGKPVVFHCFKNGSLAMELEFTVTADGTESSPLHRIQTQNVYDDGGRRYTQTSETVLNGRLEPVSYERERVLTMSHGGARRACSATLDVGEASISLTDNAGRVREHEKKLPVPCYLFDDLAVEQMALLAPVVHARGEGTYAMLVVEGLKFYAFVFKKVRVETVGGRKLTRWEFKDPKAFSGIMWINEDGTMEKYQQKYFEQLFEASRVRE